MLRKKILNVLAISILTLPMFFCRCSASRLEGFVKEISSQVKDASIKKALQDFVTESSQTPKTPFPEKSWEDFARVKVEKLEILLKEKLEDADNCLQEKLDSRPSINPNYQEQEQQHQQQEEKFWSEKTTHSIWEEKICLEYIISKMLDSIEYLLLDELLTKEPPKPLSKVTVSVLETPEAEKAKTPVLEAPAPEKENILGVLTQRLDTLGDLLTKLKKLPPDSTSEIAEIIPQNLAITKEVLNSISEKLQQYDSIPSNKLIPIPKPEDLAEQEAKKLSIVKKAENIENIITENLLSEKMLRDVLTKNNGEFLHNTTLRPFTLYAEIPSDVNNCINIPLKGSDMVCTSKNKKLNSSNSSDVLDLSNIDVKTVKIRADLEELLSARNILYVLIPKKSKITTLILNDIEFQKSPDQHVLYGVKRLGNRTCWFSAILTKNFTRIADIHLI